jgi:hypothetical protein
MSKLKWIVPSFFFKSIAKSIFLNPLPAGERGRVRRKEFRQAGLS